MKHKEGAMSAKRPFGSNFPAFSFAILAGALLLAGILLPGGGAGAAQLVPAARTDVAPAKELQTAVLAGGCFWGLEGVFERVKGVREVVSGYAGGTARDASYEMVSSERTRHAEAVRIRFDPAQVSYATLLRIYFSVTTDPTQLNRQGPDAGPSYRSAIFPQNGEQERVARAYIAQLSQAKVYGRPIVTKIERGAFYPAESYHQDFMRKNPGHPYIVAHDVPKVQALKKLFPNLYRG
jgi:peptide-methionine (S)-S-oxide reductase